MAASAIMTIIVLAVLSVTTNILNTWNRASGELKNKFDATVVGNILQDDFESVMIKRDGRAWFQVDYPDNVGVLSGSNYLDATPLKPPEIMFFSSTVLRPRYTRDQISTANQGDVVFSDGTKAEWRIDRMGQLGLIPEAGKTPPQSDMYPFQLKLQELLSKM